MGTATTPPTEDLRPILEEVRKDLLDLGLRNPLLNYRLLKSRGLETVGTSPRDVFQSLVAEGQELELLSAHGVAPRKQLLLADGQEDASVGERPGNSFLPSSRLYGTSGIYPRAHLWLFTAKRNLSRGS